MRRKILASLCLSVFLALLVTAASSNTPHGADLRVTFINVGQGDSALISDPNGFDILIDGGKPSAGTTVLQFLREQAVDDVDVMVVTHADADHSGGLVDVLQAADIPVEKVYYNGYPGTTVTWHNLETAVAGESLSLTPAQFPMELTWGETTAYILNPVSWLVNPDTNDASVVILLKHGQNDFLFTGDIDYEIEATVVLRQTPIAAEILKVPHHGSDLSSSDRLLATVLPREAIISVGADNQYGHPGRWTLARLRSYGAKVWRTDQYFNITVFSDGQTYTVSPQAALRLLLPFIIFNIPGASIP